LDRPLFHQIPDSLFPSIWTLKSAVSDHSNPVFLRSCVKELIAPHGGRLIDRRGSGTEREYILERSNCLKAVNLSQREVSDLEMIAIGAFSPLEGFQGSADYKSILANKRLVNGLPWTIPITLLGLWKPFFTP
jgi:hypothetical protein